MGKRILAVSLTVALLVGAGLPGAGAAGPQITAPSAILMDGATGTILYEQNARELLPPASVTKVMTLLLLMEALEAGRISWDDPVTASRTAAGKGGSQIYLEEGETMPLEEMFKAVVVSSANDCATALAEHLAGSEAVFVEQMNARAQELGMVDTTFCNCTGLDDGPEGERHRTSARDVALMSRALLQHDRIRDFTTIWMDTVRDGQFGLSNTNKLIRFYEGATGLKTGYTGTAGHCLAASARREGMELIAVVLHCSSSADRFRSAEALLDYGFANYALITPRPPEPLRPIPVALGKSPALTPVLREEEPLLVEKGRAAGLETEVRLAEAAEAPIREGQVLGTLTLRAGGEVLKEIPLVAPRAVERITWWDATVRLLRAMCMGREPEGAQ